MLLGPQACGIAFLQISDLLAKEASNNKDLSLAKRPYADRPLVSKLTYIIGMSFMFLFLIALILFVLHEEGLFYSTSWHCCINR